MTAPSGRLAAAIVLGIAAAFAAAHLASVWQPYRWLHGDGSFYYGVAENLLQNGSLDLGRWHPRSWYELDLGWNRSLDAGFSNVALGGDGRTWYPKHPLLLPVLAAPLIFAFGPWGALVFNLALVLLVPLFAWRIAERLAPGWAALAAGALFAAQPLLIEHAWNFSNDLLQTALVLASLDQAFRGRSLLAGVLLGVATWAKVTTVVLVPALALVLVLRGDRRGLVRAAAGYAVPVLLLAGVHWALYGGPVTTGYQRVLVRKAGELTLASHTADFRWGLFSSRLGVHGGALVRAWPVLLLAVAGVAALYRRHRFAAASALGWGLVAPVVFHAPFDWYRPSFVLPAAALAVPAAAAALALGRAPAVAAPGPPRLRGLRLALIALVAVPLAVGGARRLLEPAPQTLAERIREAEVHLGEVPCDYFNHQNRRWECASFDRGRDALMTGASREHPTMVHLAPHPTGKPRRITWPLAPGASWAHVVYRLEAGARGNVEVRVLVDGGVVQTLTARAGRDEATIALSAGASRFGFEVGGRGGGPVLLDARVE